MRRRGLFVLVGAAVLVTFLLWWRFAALPDVRSVDLAEDELEPPQGQHVTYMASGGSMRLRLTSATNVTVCNRDAATTMQVHTTPATITHARVHGGDALNMHPLPPGRCMSIEGKYVYPACPHTEERNLPLRLRRPEAKRADGLRMNGTVLTDHLRYVEEHTMSAACDFGGARALLFGMHFARMEMLEFQALNTHALLADGVATVFFIDAYPMDMEGEEELQFAYGHQRGVRPGMLQRCDLLGLCCVAVPYEVHTPCPYAPERGVFGERLATSVLQSVSMRASSAMQWALDHFGYPFDGVVALIDGDMALVEPFDPAAFLEKGKTVASWISLVGPKHDIAYMYNGVFVIDNRVATGRYGIQWCYGDQLGVRTDTGGCTRPWLLAHGGEHQVVYPEKNEKTGFWHFGPKFLHYQGGAMWEMRESGWHDAKFARFYCIVVERLKAHVGNSTMRGLVSKYMTDVPDCVSLE